MSPVMIIMIIMTIIISVGFTIFLIVNLIEGNIARALRRFAWFNNLKVALFNYVICEYDNSGKYFIRKGRVFIKYFNEHETYSSYRWCTIDIFNKTIKRYSNNPLYNNIDGVGKAWDEHILNKSFNVKVIYVEKIDE